MDGMNKYTELSNLFNPITKSNRVFGTNSQQNSYQQIKDIQNQTNGRMQQQKKGNSTNSLSQFLEGQNAQNTLMNKSITKNFFEDRGQQFQRQAPFFTPQKQVKNQVVNNSDSTFQLQQLLGQQNQNIMFNEGKLIKQQQQENKQQMQRDEQGYLPIQHQIFKSYENRNLFENQYGKKNIQIENQSLNTQLIKVTSNRENSYYPQINSNEQIFLSEREIQLPPISNLKLSQFNNGNKKYNINSQTMCKTEPDVQTNQLCQDIIKNSSQSINKINQENLKDWFSEKDNQIQQPVLAKEIKRESSNDNQAQKKQILLSPQSKLSNSQIFSYKSLNQQRRFLDRKNSKEQRLFSSQDVSEHLSSSQDSFQSAATKLLSNQKQHINQPSHFKSISNTQENLVPNQQVESQVQPSQSVLQKILFTPNSKPPQLQTSTSPMDMIIQQKKSTYKQRKNKLQSWMNELNSELNGSGLGDSQDIQNNNENKGQILHYLNDNQTAEKQGYQQNFIFQENKQADVRLIKDTKFPILPSNENNQFQFTKLDHTTKVDQNQDSQSNKQIFLNQNSNISDNIEKKASFQTNFQSQRTSFNNNFNKNQQVLESDENRQNFQLRHKSEPKLGLSMLQDGQDQITNLLQNLESQTPQKSDTKKYMIKIIKNECSTEDNVNLRNNNQQKQFNVINQNLFGQANVKQVKSILKKRTASLKTLSHISEFGENETNKKIQNTRNIFNSPPTSEKTIQSSHSNSQTFDITPQKSYKTFKKVNFQEKVSVIDIRTKELSTTTITKQQIYNHNEEIKKKQKEEHL